MLAASCAGWSKSREEIYADVAKKIPVQRMGQPMDVANVVSFLFSDDAGFVNGSVVNVEGGTLCLPRGDACRVQGGVGFGVQESVSCQLSVGSCQLAVDNGPLITDHRPLNPEP